jgi:hypothetical protein
MLITNVGKTMQVYLKFRILLIRKCPNPFYCSTCFKISHKNYHRRNHHFYELSDKMDDIKCNIFQLNNSKEPEEVDQLS